ncbi:MAG: DNA-3-methyladenine glycosylase family protein [Candidatus Binataceae bacterium]
MARLKFTLRAQAPFRLDHTVWALRRRPHNTIDRFDAGVWRRILAIGGKPVALAVRQLRTGAQPEIEITATGAGAVSTARPAIESIVKKTLSLESDLAPFYRMAERDPVLAPIVSRLSGMKPPRFPSIFEAFGNAISGQLVSLTAGLHVLNRVADAYGLEAECDGVAIHSFPEPRLLIRSTPDALRALGLSRPKARYLIDLARIAMNPRDRDFSSLEALDDSEAIKRMCALSGVGRWTAEYVLLRGLGRVHIFPGDDVGGQNGLAKFLGLERKLDHAEVGALLARWHPYAGLIYLHLLVDAIAQRGDGS